MHRLLSLDLMEKWDSSIGPKTDLLNRQTGLRVQRSYSSGTSVNAYGEPKLVAGGGAAFYAKLRERALALTNPNASGKCLSPQELYQPGALYWKNLFANTSYFNATPAEERLSTTNFVAILGSVSSEFVLASPPHDYALTCNGDNDIYGRPYMRSIIGTPLRLQAVIQTAGESLIYFTTFGASHPHIQSL